MAVNDKDTYFGKVGAHMAAQLAVRDRRIAALQSSMDSITAGNDDNVGRYNYYNAVFELSPCRYATHGGVERALAYSYHYYDRIINSGTSIGIATEYDYRMFYIEHFVWWLVRRNLDGIANVWKADMSDGVIDISTDGSDAPFDDAPLSTSLAALREGIAGVGADVRELPSGWSIHAENVGGYNSTAPWQAPDTADWTEGGETGMADSAVWGAEYPPSATDATSLKAGLFAWMRHLVFQLTDAEYFAMVKSWKRSIEHTMNKRWNVFTFRRLTCVDGNGAISHKTPDINSGY